ncbi:MAG: ABC transporter permease [Chloroflexota bacterium]
MTEQELFAPLVRETTNAQVIVRPSTTYWQDVWRRLKKNRGAIIGLILIGLIIALAIFGPMLSPYKYSDQDLQATNRPPSARHWFGTDNLGRDLLTRVLFGARISLSIGFVASLIILTIGIIYGGISGFFGGQVDNLMMRIVDILWAIPLTLFVIMLMVVMGSGLLTIFVALGSVYWVGMARIVRGQIISLKNQEFVLAARTIGASNWRILLRHLIPNAMGPIIVTVTMNIPNAIFTEAFLSFIGLGVSAPMASWGVLANDGAQSIRAYPWQIFFPALAISLTMLAFNFLGDGLRDALDPRMRR